MSLPSSSPISYQTPTLPQLPGGDPVFWRNELAQISKSINSLTGQFNAGPATLLGGLRWGPTMAGIPSQSTGELYYDNTNTFAENDAALNVNVDLGSTAPPGVVNTTYFSTQSRGDNTTFIGGCTVKIIGADRAGVSGSTKGVLYPLYVSCQPSVARNNSPFDDADGILIQNDGTAKGADALYIGQGGGFAGHQWANAVAVGGSADNLLFVNGSYTNGLSLASGTFSGTAIATPGFSVDGSGNATVASLAITGGAWTAFTPSPVWANGTSPTATFTVNQARYNKIGKTVTWMIDISVSATGTTGGATQVNFTLPTTPQSAGGGSGADNNATFRGMCEVHFGLTTNANIRHCDLTAFATNMRMQLSGVYEST